MPLLSTLVNGTLGSNLQRFLDFYAQIVLPQLQRNKSSLVPLVAVTVLTLGLLRLYQKITKPPAHLRHLPHCDIFACLKYYISDGLIENYSKEVILPTVEKNPVFTRFAAEGWVVDIADPIAAKQMLLKTDAFPKSDTTMGEVGTLIQRFLGGPNIVFLNGADWKRHRKIANPAFHRAFPVKLFGRLTQTMFTTIEELGEKINVIDLFTRLTLDVIGTAGFNFNALTDNNNEWVRGYNNIKAHKDLDDFLAMMEKIIENKRRVIQEQRENAQEDNEKDLLTLMIESEMNDGDGEVLSNEELKSNLCIFFLAGHDTTAFTLACALYELAMNPDVQDKARQEIIDILGDDPQDVLPTIEQTKRMNYLNTVIKETLRLHDPLLTTTSRKATEDCELGGNFIPKGTLVSVDIYSLHRNPKVWKDPLRFDPDRFAPGGEAERQPGSGMAWIPFSNGGRQCIGMNFSLVQQRVVLAMLLRKYTFHLPSDSIHKNSIKSRGIAFGIIAVDDLNIEFKRRYKSGHRLAQH